MNDVFKLNFLIGALKILNVIVR